MRQTINFNAPVGTVVQNVHRDKGRPLLPPSQSKGQPRTVKFYPDMESAVNRACRAERCTFTEFIEKVSNVGVDFNFSHIDTLLKHRDLFDLILDDEKIIEFLRHILIKKI